MGVIQRIGKLTKHFILLGFFTLLVVTAYTFLWPKQDISKLPKANAIVCLGGGMLKDGTILKDTRGRVRKCVELYQAGLAPVVAFTGGRARPDGPSAGEGMASYAIELGLPAEAAISENASQSTMQNALYTLPLLPTTEGLIIVTEAFHLPRSWVTFQWMGADDLTLVASEKLRTNEHGLPQFDMLLREAAAIWFNLGRASVWSTARLFEAENDAWLH